MKYGKDFSLLKWFIFPGVCGLFLGCAVLKWVQKFTGADLAVLITFAAMTGLSSVAACYLMGHQSKPVRLLAFILEIILMVGTMIVFTIAVSPLR